MRKLPLSCILLLFAATASLSSCSKSSTPTDSQPAKKAGSPWVTFHRITVDFIDVGAFFHNTSGGTYYNNGQLIDFSTDDSSGSYLSEHFVVYNSGQLDSLPTVGASRLIVGSRKAGENNFNDSIMVDPVTQTVTIVHDSDCYHGSGGYFTNSIGKWQFRDIPYAFDSSNRLVASVVPDANNKYFSGYSWSRYEHASAAVQADYGSSFVRNLPPLATTRLIIRSE
jgi:hypothetical protein